MTTLNDLRVKAAADYTEGDLKASVGRYGPAKKECYNTVWDQEMVRTLLNAVPVRFGGRYDVNDRTGSKLLTGPLTWGRVRNDLYAAIVDFQKNPYNRAEGLILDGHVDPHEKTIRRLLYLRNWKPPVPDGDQAIHHKVDVDIDIPAPDYTDDLNTVFAGSHFRIRIQYEVTASAAFAGSVWIKFMIWDVDNKRAALYRFSTNTISIGILPVSGSYSSWADWSDVFYISPKAIQVDMFACLKATLASAGFGVGASPSFLIFKFGKNDYWDGGVMVNVPTGVTIGPPGADFSWGGPLTLISGSVKVFKGP